jgi:hypothetical protein
MADPHRLSGKFSGHVAKLPACLRLAKNSDRLLSSQNLGETMVVNGCWTVVARLRQRRRSRAGDGQT